MKGKIYIAEDNEGIRKLLGELFSTFLPEYSIELFSDGLTLQSRLESSLGNSEDYPKLIITDNNVPQRDLGLKLAKQYSSEAGIPVIIMSSSSIEKESKDAGAYGFIQKPFKIFQFVELAETALSSKG